MHKGRARHSNRVAWLGFVKCLRISRQCAVCSVHSFILLLIKILLSTWCVQGNIPKKMEILIVISFYCLFLKGMKKPENSQMAVQLSTPENPRDKVPYWSMATASWAELRVSEMESSVIRHGCLGRSCLGEGYPNNPNIREPDFWLLSIKFRVLGWLEHFPLNPGDFMPLSPKRYMLQ